MNQNMRPDWPRMGVAAEAVDVALLDTSAIVKERWLQSEAYRRIVSGSERHLVLLIPQVVLDELTNKHAQELERLSSDLLSVERKFRDLTAADLGADALAEDISRFAMSNEDILDRAVKHTGPNVRVIVLDYPTEPHQRVVERLLAGKAPFRREDRDYKDFLIWQSLVEWPSRNDSNLGADICSLSIISGDKRAFALDGEMHPELREPLSAVYPDLDEIYWFENLHRFEEGILAERVGWFELLGEKIPWIVELLSDPAKHEFSRYYDHHGMVPWSFQGSESITDVSAIREVAIVAAYRWGGRSWATGFARGVFVLSFPTEEPQAVHVEPDKVLMRKRNQEWPSLTDFIIETDGVLEFEVASQDDFRSIENLVIHSTYPGSSQFAEMRILASAHRYSGPFRR